MKKAVIDIGTNSTRLFIAELEDDSISQSITRKTEITRLGEDVSSKKRLKKTAINRTFKVLEEYNSLIKETDVDSIKAVATSAVRDAKNANDFLDKISEELHIEVEVVSGSREAGLSFAGAISDEMIKKSGQYYMIIDIGGGSTEIIFGDKNQIIQSQSMDIGCIRMSEKFLKTDPPKHDELKKLRAFVRKQLELTFKGSLPKGIKREELSVIALAGTATSLVSIYKELDKYDSKQIHGSPISRENIEYLVLKLSKLSVEELRSVRGLHPKRAEVIVAGAAIQAEIMEYFRLEKMIVSESDILNGIMLDKAG